MNDIAYGCDKTLTNDTKQPKSFAYKQPKNRIQRESKARVNKQAHAKIARKYTQIKGKKRIEHTLIHGDKGNEIDTKKELALRMKTPSETTHSRTHTHTAKALDLSMTKPVSLCFYHLTTHTQTYIRT